MMALPARIPSGYHRETVTVGGEVVADACYENPATGGENPHPSDRGGRPTPAPSGGGVSQQGQGRQAINTRAEKSLACSEARVAFGTQLAVDALFYGSLAAGGWALLGARAAAAEASSLYRLGLNAAEAVQRSWQLESIENRAALAAGVALGGNVYTHNVVASHGGFSWNQFWQSLPGPATYYAYQGMKAACAGL